MASVAFIPAQSHSYQADISTEKKPLGTFSGWVQFFACDHCNSRRKNDTVILGLKSRSPQCLKITEKVSFDIASGASYVYISGKQKFIKNAKNGSITGVFENLKLAV